MEETGSLLLPVAVLPCISEMLVARHAREENRTQLLEISGHGPFVEFR